MHELVCAAIYQTRRAAGIALATLSVGAFAVTVALLFASMALEPDPPDAWP